MSDSASLSSKQQSLSQQLLFDTPHRRYNPLRRQWVLVSPHRTARPWQGEVNQASGFSDQTYDPACYLCPGNTRAGGHQTPGYESIYVFDNDYAALLPELPAGLAERSAGPASAQPARSTSLLRAEPETGRCRVLCFHPHHNLTMARMAPEQITRVVEEWQKQYRELGSDPNINYVQIFENRGAMMGASNPHPHGQIWATHHLPDEPALEGEALRAYHAEHGGCLLCDYLAEEGSQQSRLVCQNEHFVALVPWWAVWPFETLVLSRRHLRSLNDFGPEERAGLADILHQLTVRYDNLFEASFPYTMGFHQSPTSGHGQEQGAADGKHDEHAEWHFHAHYYPPLLRSATVRKFMVGFEMLGMPQRDITPESAAERLRSVAATHFMDRKS